MDAIIERIADKYYVLKRPGYDDIGSSTITALKKWAKKIGVSSIEYIDKRKKKISSHSLDNPAYDLQRSYQEFHGHDPRTKRSWNFHVPKGFVILGKAIAVEYETDKLNGGGDGKKAVYRHEFDKSTLLLMDERQAKQLYIVGPKLIVTDRGIEH